MSILSWYMGENVVPDFTVEAQWRDVLNHILFDRTHRCAPGVLQELVKNGGDKEIDGNTVAQLVLYKAISNWDVQAVSWIVDHHCPTENDHLTHQWGSYIYHTGMVVFPPEAYHIQLDILDKLLPVFSDYGRALDLAVMENRMDCVKKLIPYVPVAFDYHLPYRRAVMYGCDEIASYLEPLSDRIEALCGLYKMPFPLDGWDKKLQTIEQHWRNTPDSPSTHLYSVCVNAGDIEKHLTDVSEKHRQQIFYVLCEQKNYIRAKELLAFIGTISYEIGHVGLMHTQILPDMLPHLTDESKQNMLHETVYCDYQDEAALILKDVVDLQSVQSMIEATGFTQDHMQKLDNWKALKTKKNLLNEINTPNRIAVRKI